MSKEKVTTPKKPRMCVEGWKDVINEIYEVKIEKQAELDELFKKGIFRSPEVIERTNQLVNEVNRLQTLLISLSDVLIVLTE